MVSNVQQEQEQAANGIGANGKPVLTKVEDFGIKLAHQFPWTPAAAVAVGLALRRRFLSSPDAPSGVVRRLQVTKVLRPTIPQSAHTFLCRTPFKGINTTRLAFWDAGYPHDQFLAYTGERLLDYPFMSECELDVCS